MITTATILALQLSTAGAQPPAPAFPLPVLQGLAGQPGFAGLDPATKQLLKELQKELAPKPLKPGKKLFGTSAGASICSNTAHLAARAKYSELQEDLILGLANCLNLTDPDDAADCMDDVWDDFYDGIDEAIDVHDARLDLCALFGEAAYDPDIDPVDFVSGVDNPYFPLPDGGHWLYEAELLDGTMEVVEVTVEDGTKTILGVECIVVRDVVMSFDDAEGGGGELVEDTLDYYAQDEDGNVWYFGEIAQEYEDGELVGIEGSWEAGKSFAKAGIIMQADPLVMQTYRQEWALDEAEDAATVISLNESVTVPYTPPAEGTFDDCVQTFDFTPLEPDAMEHKYYAPGLGLVLEVDLLTGERLELVDFFLDAD